MNEIVDRFLLAGDKFISEIYLRKTGFTYSPCGVFTKNKERVQKFEKTGASRYTYKNKLDKRCFEYDMAYEDLKDLPKRRASDKVLRDKVFDWQHDLNPQTLRS